ncbi:MAG TPA: hypothetical protein VGM53_36150 [Streptosporangiaceae bacterium]|jgi:hypothetical protein
MRIASAAAVAAVCCGVLAGAAAAPGRAAAAVASPAGDSPDGFWYGTDSWPITIGGNAPYQEPAIGGNYGGYIGMAGSWAWWEGCHGQVAWSSDNSTRANTNYRTYHKGIGTGVYWFMGGPGVDANYNGTTAEAYSFGENQARKTLYELGHMHISLTYPVIFADIELPGIAPAPDNGWNSVYTSPCSGTVKQSYVPVALDRADFNGYAAYLTSHSAYKVGVYSAPQIWTDIFGTGVDSLIPNTYEWTYSGYTSSLSHTPDGWCLRGTDTCAAFFGGQKSTSQYALMWQWSGGGGTSNGYGDFDQIDSTRTP